jgi:hypothetical protein
MPTRLMLRDNEEIRHRQVRTHGNVL